MKEKFKSYGETLGLRAETEVKIPKGRIDCIWETKEPISEYFIAFEFETATSGSQIVENLVKSLSLAPQRRPRFLVQVYKEELSEDNREYLERISSILPIAIKIISNVGENVEEAAKKVMIDLFNWIGEYAEISKEFISNLERIIPSEKIIKIFHYGEEKRSHLEYLDRALRNINDFLVWIRSTPKQENKKKVLSAFQDLQNYDVVIISDVKPEECDMDSLRKFLAEEVRKKGKSLILTGGWGLTKEYNRELGIENLGGKVIKRKDDEVAIESEKGFGFGLIFKGFNVFEPANPEEVIAFFKPKDLPSHQVKERYPALIVHKNGKGNVIIFISDCSPTWGTPAINTEEFRDMWKRIIENYCINRNI
ncbi:MAG TPA: hypothetical protein EYP68_05675 [Candidatus Korarchaeota archaeon]|nr:hypothetical protein [Candidatus Korarchaeota archaeon]